MHPVVIIVTALIRASRFTGAFPYSNILGPTMTRIASRPTNRFLSISHRRNEFRPSADNDRIPFFFWPPFFKKRLQLRRYSDVTCGYTTSCHDCGVVQKLKPGADLIVPTLPAIQPGPCNQQTRFSTLACNFANVPRVADTSG